MKVKNEDKQKKKKKKGTLILSYDKGDITFIKYPISMYDHRYSFSIMVSLMYYHDVHKARKHFLKVLPDI